ncbi:MAG: ABC transporter permease [Thermotogota bacterium]
MKRFLNTLKLDATVANRNWLFIIVIAIALLYVGLINWVIPEELSMEMTSNQIILDNTKEKDFEKMMISQNEGIKTADSREEMLSFLEENDSSIGIIFNEKSAEIINQGYESEKQINFLKATLNTLYTQPQNINIETQVLEETEEKLTMNKKMFPILLATDVIILGFLFAATMIFQEKNDGSIYAYRVSSAGTGNYIMSKLIVNTLMAVIFSVIFAVFTVGFNFNYGGYLLIVVMSSAFITLLGMFLGQFYNSISEFIYIIMALSIIMTLPVISYMSPAFSMDIFKIIPAYPVIYIIDGFLKGYTPDIFGNTVIILTIEIIVMYAITHFSIKKHLIRK